MEVSLKSHLDKKSIKETVVEMGCLKREYPAKPIVGIGAVIVDDGNVLLAKRGSEPGKNKWSIPGGLVELGETVQETVVRSERRNQP